MLNPTRKKARPMALHSLIAKRRSLRAIDQNKPVPSEIVETLLEAARWAPSSGNSQPWQFVVVSAPDALQRAREALRPGNQTWANRAPVLFVICANPEDDATADGKPYYLFDCGMAAENLILQGIEEGLVMHPMLGWHEEPMRAALEIPEPVRVVVVIAAGYPGALVDLPDDLQQRETGERKRKSLAEMTHYNRWENQKAD